MIRKITSLLIAGIMGGTLTAVADEIEFTYNPGLENASVYGYNRKESYDVAIRVRHAVKGNGGLFFAISTFFCKFVGYRELQPRS